MLCFKATYLTVFPVYMCPVNCLKATCPTVFPVYMCPVNCLKATCPTVFPVYMCPVNCYALFEGNISNCFSSLHVSCQLLYFVWRQHVQLFFQYTCVLSIVWRQHVQLFFQYTCFLSIVWRQHVQLFFQYTCVLSIVILCLKATYPTVFPVYMCPVNCYALFEGNMSNCFSSIHVSCQLFEGNMSNCFSSIHVSCQLLYFVWRQHIQLFFQYTCVLSIVILGFKATCPTVVPVYMCPVNCYALF